MTTYSIIMPFHNEGENVTELDACLKQVMEQASEPFELVLVDDGSSDRTYELLEEIAAVDSRVLVVKLRRNFGQTSALAKDAVRRTRRRDIAGSDKPCSATRRTHGARQFVWPIFVR